MPFSFDLSLILYAWLVLFILQLAVAPVLGQLLPRLADRGWAWGRLVGWLTISLIVWNLGYFNIPANQQSVVWAIFMVIIFICGVYNFQHRKEFKTWISKIWYVILLEEFLFLVGFVVFGLIRSFNPSMLDLEKFMDGGMIASYLRSPTLPAQDMWLSGYNFNYYTFGHFMGAILSRVWAVDLAYSFNLLLATIFAMTLAGGFSLLLTLVNLYEKKMSRGSVFGALVGTMALIFGGNSHTLWYLLKNQSLTGYWYAEATRFIPFTIHEFPSYSFVVSDLHAHVWDLPIVLLFLTLSFIWWRSIKEDQTSHVLTLAMGGLLGIMGMTNTWDLMIYGAYLGFLFLLLLLDRKVLFMKLVFTGVEILAGTALVIYWWWVNFTSISDGIRLVEQASPFWQLASLWGTHVVMGLVALTTVVSISRKKVITLKHPLILALVLIAFFFLALPEFIYFKDIYPSHPRANTMFKLTYQAFIMLTLVTGWLVGSGFSSFRRKHWLGLVRGGIGLVGAGIFLLFPLSAYQNYYGDFKQQKYLDGLAWMELESPDDYAMVIWLKQNIAGRPVTLEAVGESYTKFDRISANTGLPTVLGWRVHEWLWRDGFDIPSQRTGEVKTIYEQPLSEAGRNLIDQYQVRYIIIGDLERETYKVNENDLLKIGDIVFRSGESEIIKLN